MRCYFGSFISHDLRRLLAACLEGFIALKQLAYLHDFSCIYASNVTKSCPKIKTVEIQEEQENALTLLMAFSILIIKAKEWCRYDIWTSNILEVKLKILNARNYFILSCCSPVAKMIAHY